MNLEIRINPGSEEPSVQDLDTGEWHPFTRYFWFALQAFHPDTELWLPKMAVVQEGEFKDLFRLSFLGDKGVNYSLETSPDLIDWTSGSVFTNRERLTDFIIQSDPDQPLLFYQTQATNP